MHNASAYVIKWCVENDLDTLVVGKNKEWKQNTDIDSIAFLTFIVNHTTHAAFITIGVRTPSIPCRPLNAFGNTFIIICKDPLGILLYNHYYDQYGVALDYSMWYGNDKYNIDSYGKFIKLCNC